MERQTIDFNTMTIEEFEQLPGIGKAKAAAIVGHRDVLSNYNSINDLVSVEGITKTLIAKLQEEYTIIFTGDKCNTRRHASYLKRHHRGDSSPVSNNVEEELPTPDKKVRQNDSYELILFSPGGDISNNQKNSISHVLPSCDSPGSAVRRRLNSEVVYPPLRLQPWLDQFEDWSREERLIALNDLIGLCDMSVVRHMMAKIEPHFQRDFISLLPKELALYVLSFLEPKDLCSAAKTCRYWRILAEDNL